MIPGPNPVRLFPLLILPLLFSCSGNVMQTTVFTDGFEELHPGQVPYYDSIDPAIYFHPQRRELGDWKVATTLRQDGFARAWQIRSDGSSNYLAQTFSNLDRNNEPLSLITHPMITAGDSLWNDYTVDLEFTPLAKFDKSGLVFKYQNPADYYFFGVEGNTVILKHIQQPVTPLRPIEQILAYRPVVWTPGERLHAMVTVRREKITAILNDSISMHVDNQPSGTGRIGLISDLPAMFHRVEVKILRGEQRKLNRRKRQLARRMELMLEDHPEMVRWKALETGTYGTDQNLRLGDLNGDGNKELLFVRHGADDPHSVGLITAVTLEGEILWQTRDEETPPLLYGDELPVQIHDLDGDGEREVILASDGTVRVLDGKSGEPVRRKRIYLSRPARTLLFGDLLGVGRSNCLVLSDRESYLVVLNERLERMWEQRTESGSQPMVYDINGDGYDDLLMGYSVFDHSGELMFDVGAFIGDRCNGVTVTHLVTDAIAEPCLAYAAGDWGVMYFDFSGNLLKQNVIGHVRFLSVADYDMEEPGMEIITSNGWGSEGLAHYLDAGGNVISRFMLDAGVTRCEPVNWKGDGEEFFIASADSLKGGMFDREGRLAVEFPPDGHPVSCYMRHDLTGDERDEVLVWDHERVWIYTQDDNPRMGNTYDPHRIPAHNHSMHQMYRSVSDR